MPALSYQRAVESQGDATFNPARPHPANLILKCDWLGGRSLKGVFQTFWFHDSTRPTTTSSLFAVRVS
eukprot:258641-Amphidinium_carterae.1